VQFQHAACRKYPTISFTNSPACSSFLQPLTLAIALLAASHPIPGSSKVTPGAVNKSSLQSSYESHKKFIYTSLEL